MMIETGQFTRRSAEAGQELVDAIVAAVDVDRAEEVWRVEQALEPFDLAQIFADEARLCGVPSHCNGECWSEVAA